MVPARRFGAMPWRRLPVPLLAIGMLLGGCGADEPDQAPRELTGSEVCPGGLLTADAVRALNLLTAGAAFKPPPRDVQDVSSAARALVQGFQANGESHVDAVCEARPVDSMNRHVVFVSFEIESEATRKYEHSESGQGYYWEYDLGRNALANARQARLYFDCVSTRLGGPEKSVPIAARASVGDMSSTTVDAAPREANLTIVHSAARAMAKELGCKDGGGLPERLVVKEKAAPTR